MKTYLLFTISILSAAAMQAQTARVISKHTSRYNGTTWIPSDTVRFEYAPGSTVSGTAEDFRKGTLLYDTMNTVFYDQPSSAYYHFGKNICRYNANGDIEERIDMNTQVITAPPMNRNRELSVYDSKGDKTHSYYFQWNATTSVWDSFYKYTYAYDANSNLLESSSFMLKAPGVWEPVGKTENTYNTGGKMLLTIGKSWDIATFTYVNSSKGEYHFNTAGDNDTVVSSYYTAGAWLPTSRNTYTYNSLHNTILYATEQYNAGTWKYSIKNETVYNPAQDKILLRKSFVWDNVAMAWAPSAVDSFETPTVPGLLMYGFTQHYWNAATNVYERSKKTAVTYNANNHPHIIVTSDWDAAANKWVIKNGDDSTIYHYNVSTSVNDIEAAANGSLKVYPNPASHMLQFELNGVTATNCKATLYDMMGRVVRQQQQALGNNSLTVGGIAEGRYILRVQAGNKQFTQNVIVAR